MFDNRDLTFGELKAILTSAAEGKLESVTEKCDGQALHFSWDSSTDDLRAARNSGDLRSGGMDVSAIAAKFYGRGNVEAAFTTAFAILRKALSALTDEEKIIIFGENTNVWYPIEIIYTQNPNVIVYDRNNIVLHMSPIITVADTGEISRDTSGESEGFELLTSKVDQMQTAVARRDWQINGPRFLQLQKLSNGTVLSKTLGAIDRAMDDASVSDSDTIETYLSQMVRNDALTDLQISDDAKQALTDYIIGIPGPGLNAIKRMVPRQQVEKVTAVARAKVELLKEYIRPLELAIHWFAVEVLRGLHSTLISDSDSEITRLRQEVARAINAIRASNDESAMTVLNTQMEKLGDVENIASAMEGVVFIVDGQAYKLTGSFSAANQILGLFKYGRGGVKPMTAESKVNDHARLSTVVDRIAARFFKT